MKITYNFFLINPSICGSNSVSKISFVLVTVVEALRKNRSAGWISRASAIFASISKEGSVLPHSMQPIVPVAQPQRSASFSWEMERSFL